MFILRHIKIEISDSKITVVYPLQSLIIFQFTILKLVINESYARKPLNFILSHIYELELANYTLDKP